MVQKHEMSHTEKMNGEKKTAFVVTFSAVTMVLEIFFGLFSKSMALLAAGKSTAGSEPESMPRPFRARQ